MMVPKPPTFSPSRHRLTRSPWLMQIPFPSFESMGGWVGPDISTTCARNGAKVMPLRKLSCHKGIAPRRPGSSNQNQTIHMLSKVPMSVISLILEAGTREMYGKVGVGAGVGFGVGVGVGLGVGVGASALGRARCGGPWARAGSPAFRRRRPSSSLGPAVKNRVFLPLPAPYVRLHKPGMTRG